MTEFNLGVLSAYATINDAPFNAAYPKLVAKFRALFGEATKAAAGVDKLDASLAGTADSSSAASASISRVTAAQTKATESTTRASAAQAKAAAAQDKAAAQAKVFADAQARVNAVMAEYAGESPKVQQAALRVAAAQDRLNAVMASGTATTRSLAAANASLIGAQRSLTSAQEAGVVTGGRFTGAMASSIKMATQLGLVFGAFEAVKKALDISHEATQFQASITRIQTQAGAAASELGGFSKSLLNMAPGVAQAPEALATSLYHVYSATKALGYTGPQMLKAVEVAAKGATVSGADLEETTNALTATMVSGLGSVNDMGKAMGALNAIVGAGDMKLSDLNEALGTGILAVAKVFGVTLAQAGAALAVFGDNNIRGAKAATTLRMVIQDLTKPASSAADVLAKIGLSVTSLRDDLEKGGLSLALQHLKTNLDQAGVTGDKVGGFIEDAFTKKAGVGLAMLLNNLDQYNQKQTQIATGARNFGAEWSATTKTARYALDRLWTSIEAGGIALASKLSPAVAQAAMWLGTAVPHALSVLYHALSPTIHLIGVGLYGAWKVLIGVLQPVASLLGTVGHWIGQTQFLTHGLIPVVLGLWAAFKGYTIAKAAMLAIQVSVSRFASTAPLALASVGASASRLIAGLSPLGIAVAGISIALLGAATRSDQSSAAMERQKELTDELTDSINKNTGALTSQSREQVIAALSSSGALDAARQLGVALGDVTRAALGNSTALKSVYAQAGITGQQMKFFGGLSDQARQELEGSTNSTDKHVAAQLRLYDALHSSNSAIRDAAHVVKNKAAADAGAAVNAHLLDRAAEQAGFAADGTIKPLTDSGAAAGGMGTAMEAAWLSGKKLAAALQGLTGRTQSAQAFIAMKQGLYGLKDAWDKNSDSIATNTKAGANNRQAIVGQIQNIQSYAATLDHGKNAGQKMYRAMTSGLSDLRAKAITELGISSAAWGRLIAKMHLTPKDIWTHLHSDTGDAMWKLHQLQTFLARLTNATYTIGVNENINVSAPNIHGHMAAGGTVRGPGTSKSDSVPIMASKGEEVIQEPYASRYRSILKAINVGRYANGGTVTTKQVGGKTVYIVNGHQYSTRAAAENAAHSASASTAETRASGRLTNISLNSSSFSWQRFQKQIEKASAAIADALKAGISHSQYVSLQQRLHRDERRGRAIERKLGRSIHGAADKLGSSLADLTNVASPSDVRGQLRSLDKLLMQAGLPKKFIEGLDNENRHLVSAVKQRDLAARGLARANSAMAAARAHEMNDYRTFSSASRGIFDITNPVASGRKITSGSLRAGQAQALTRVRQWVSGITKLAGKHIFPAVYLRQLAGSGPTPENLATVQALLSMSGSGLRDFAAQDRQIAQLSNQGARVVAGRLDARQLRIDDRRVRHWQKIEARRQERLERVVGHMGQEIVDELRHLHIEHKIKGGDLVIVLQHGAKERKAHHRTGHFPVGGRR